LEIEEAAAELEQLNDESEKNNDPAVPYRTALAKATQFLKNPYAAWQQVDQEEQHQLYSLVFDDKLVYDPKNGYRTDKIPTAVSLFEEFATANSVLVHPDLRTLNQIKNYLERFWEHYQSGAAFRETLEIEQ
jgi:hypothetical protein